ncbi:MAG: DUF262 domain-containing HNH endonuclease family protein [Actinomycetia bacterium]|nr:DUF262 domain-containing HNH endonuclease family protein [Actinomycetes bacterium]
MLVAIDLTGHDDAQLIFETLNDRGTPLLKADLIKNWVFRKGEKLKADVERWAVTHWAEFDTDWWREEINQGRLTRSRVDIFLQYWLTMRRQEEVKTEDAFRIFVAYAEPRMESANTADGLLRELRRDADTYRDFAELHPDSTEGRFHNRVIERLELAVTTPLFLWMLSANHGVPAEQVRTGLEALESWAIRRTLLRMTTKDVNKFVVAALKMMENVSAANAGEALRDYLSEQTAETRIWPSDSRMMTQLPALRMYGSVRQDRLRVVLGAVERHLRARSSMYEEVQLPDGLELEHVMPQGWRSHWNAAQLDPDAAAERDRIVNTIGNLTLTTKSLNISLSNRPWLDRDADGLREGGRAGEGKRSLLNGFSLLVLNKEIVIGHGESWSEADIAERSEELTRVICQFWTGPSMDLQAAATEESNRPPEPADLQEISWTETDVRRLSGEVGETMLIVLDTLAAGPGVKWSNADFVDADLTTHAYAALGALAVKVKASFHRTNGPIIYTNTDSTWAWSLSEEFAEMWRRARASASASA